MAAAGAFGLHNHELRHFYTSLLYTSLLYTSLLYTSLLYTSLLYTSLLYTSLLYTSLLYTSLLYTSLLYTSLLYTSLLIRHGESVKVVQARRGHASAAETLDSEDRTRAAVDAVLRAGVSPACHEEAR